MTNLVGQDIGRYHIVEQLGQGGMATVYRAYDNRLEREVAIKFIRREEIGPAYLEQLFKRFEREAKSLAQLSHPNIVKVYDYGEFETVPYLVMEYLPGGTLKQRMGRPAPAAEAARVLLPIARALAYAHRENIIHRDVKPANILITRSGEPMLTDFGIAKILSGEGGMTLTGTGVGLGTPDYMAPEQWTNQVVPQTDIYALGIVFYEMVTGRRPFTADTPAAVLLKQMQDALPRPQSFAPDLPDQAEQFLYKSLAKDPKDRFATMDLMAAALEALMQTSATHATAPVVSTAGVETVLAPRPQAAPKPRPAGTGKPVDAAAPVSPPSASAETMVKAEPTAQVPVAPEGPVARRAPIPVWVWVVGVLAVVACLALVGGGIAALVVPGLPKPTSTPAPTLAPTSLPTQVPAPTSLPTEAPVAAPTSAGAGLGPGRVADKDGMPQVYVPGGPFIMGSDDAAAAGDQRPRHIVRLDDFWIDQTDVTNAMFVKFTAATGYETQAQAEGVGYAYVQGRWGDVTGADWLHPQGPASNIKSLSDHPVVQVSWRDAQAYCRWAGRHLPTEAQWEKAARGRDGRNYPWGDSAPGQHLLNYNLEIGGTTQVGLYPKGASPYGALDMSGNVWNWVVDWYDAGYYAHSPVANPLGPDSGELRVLRGGSWFDPALQVRSTARFQLSPNSRGSNTGFRCASSP